MNWVKILLFLTEQNVDDIKIYLKWVKRAFVKCIFSFSSNWATLAFRGLDLGLFDSGGRIFRRINTQIRLYFSKIVYINWLQGFQVWMPKWKECQSWTNANKGQNRKSNHWLKIRANKILQLNNCSSWRLLQTC